MKTYLNNLSVRDRRIVMTAAPVVLFMVAYLFFWQPLSQQRDRLASLVVEKEHDLIWMKRAAKEAGLLQQDARQKLQAGQSMMALMDKTARQAGLSKAMKRVEPEGDNKVKVRLEQVVFDDMITWVELLQSRYGVVIDAVTIDRHEAQGIVNARLTFKGA